MTNLLAMSFWAAGATTFGILIGAVVLRFIIDVIRALVTHADER